MRILVATGLSLIALSQMPVIAQVERAEALRRRAYSAEEVGNYAEAERLERQAIATNPNHIDSYNTLALLLASQGRTDEAEALYREALSRDPRDAFTYNNLGVLLNQQGRYEEAEEAYRITLQLDPFANAYYGFSSALIGQSRYEEAEETIREANRFYPEFARGRLILGLILELQGRNDEALAAYGAGIRLEPDSAFAYESLARFFRTRGRLEDAVKLYRQALSIDPNLETAQVGLSETERLLTMQAISDSPAETDVARGPLNNSLQPVMRSVVRVVTSTYSGIQYGTGWVVKREGNRVWVLTNRHVVTESVLSDTGTTAQSASGALVNSVDIDLFSEPLAGQTYRRLSAKVIEATVPTENLDLALLLLEDVPEDIQPIEISDAPIERRDNLTVIGHPLTNTPWTVDEGFLSNRDNQTIQISRASFGPGSSGSPVLNDQGRVIGILYDSVDTRATGTSSGFGIAYRLDYIRPLLQQWGVI